MLPIDLPTANDVLHLGARRHPASVSIYVETTPVTSGIGASRIAFANAAREALAQTENLALRRGAREALAEQFDALAEDGPFWAVQARSLGVFATPGTLVSYRLASRVAPTVQVSDRFHLKPLLRAVTFPSAGFVLALSEKGARLVEFFASEAAATVPVADMPADAAAAVGKASLNDRSHDGRIAGSEGKKVRLRQYARGVDAAVRPVLAGQSLPLVLAANPPLGPIFRSLASYPHLVGEGVEGEIDRMTDAELAERARRIVDGVHAAHGRSFGELYRQREAAGRATSDLAVAARAAMQGAIETLMVDMDAVVPGTIDETTGAVAFADEEGPQSYGIADRIAVLALGTGARVLSARSADLPVPGAALAAMLRYPV